MTPIAGSPRMIRVISYWHHEWPSRLETVLNEFGARGISAIGHAGIAAALTADVYHATGVRVRELPVHIEDLLAHACGGAASIMTPPLA